MPNAEELNRELRDLILAQRDRDKGLALSNVGGWHSDTQMLRWGGGPSVRLLERIMAAVDHFTVDIRSNGGPRYKWFPEMWANVSAAGASNQYHTHPGCFWSAVYYVDDGYDGSPDETLGGELVLLDPRMPGIAMNAPDLRFRRPGQEPEQRERFMRPESGRIVIFPAWLSHAVQPFRGPGTRISIAVNLSAVPLSISAQATS
ncbi:MAG: 2OG-Fe(II) oxygenase family protein [Sphingomonas sp.]|nr:2OG-Fe(II) oxygenase family protein [Sphingomonas sp.]